MRKSTRTDYYKRINLVLDHARQHLDDVLEPDGMARMACFSLSHFHRIFKGMIGETFMEHVRRLRLERAAILLGHTRLTVTRIGLDAGYESPEAFSRAFRTAFDLSPTAYRNKTSAKAAEPLPAQTLNHPQQGEPPVELTVKHLDPIRVAFVRHTGPYIQCEKAWTTLYAWAGPKNLLGPRTQFLGISYDDPAVTPPDKIRYDACITVGDGVEAEEDVEIKTLPGGDFACAVHKGPYQDLEKSYAQIMGVELPKLGRDLDPAPSIEVYLNDPGTTPAEELLTEIRVPLA